MLIKKIPIIFASLAILLLISQIAAADTIIPFPPVPPESIIHWPGYSSPDSSDNSQDTIGDPDIIGGRAYFNAAGELYQVQFDYSSPPGWDYALMEPGDLFLASHSDNDNWDGTWDWVVSLYNGVGTDEHDKYIPTGTVGLYGTTGGSILETGSADNPPVGDYWHGYGFRNDHPFAYTDLSDYLGTATVSGGFSGSPVIFDFLTNPLDVGDGWLTIGFTENCANDVVLQVVSVPPEAPPTAPEPSTLILLGLGLTGLVAYRKIKG